jgi:outer membrane protein TolC
MYRFSTVLVLAALLPVQAVAQPREYSEAEIVAAARAGSIELRAARAGAAASGFGRAQVTRPDPMLEVMPMIAAIRDGEPGTQLMVRQALPWPARLAAERSARVSMAAAESLEADALELEVVAMARMAYAELWGVQAQADRIRAFRQQLDLYRAAALAQYAAGRGPQQAVLDVHVEAGMLDQRLVALAEDRAAAAARLFELTGGRVYVDVADRLAAPAGTASAGLPRHRQPDPYAHPVVAAGRAKQAAELSMAEMNRSMLRPGLTVGVNLNLSRMAFDRMYGTEPVMPAIGVMLPLQRSAVRARVREAELRAAQRELESASAGVRLAAEAAALADQLTGVRGRIASYEGTLRPRAAQALDASLAGYRAGTARLLDLLASQRMALDVDLDLILARVREAELVARLDAIAGSAPYAGAAARNERK